MTKKSYEIEILVNGKPVKEYSKNGKIYIEGRKGREFSLRIRNNSNERILAIPSVDGLSVMNGKTASFDSSGYILKPYSSITVDGWRTSDKEVAKFFFSSIGDAYAETKDKGDNIGVIGMAVFGEKDNDLEKIKQALKELQDKPQKVIHEYHHDHHHNCVWQYCFSCGTYHYSCQHCPAVRFVGSSGGNIIMGSIGSSGGLSLNTVNTTGSASANVSSLSNTSYTAQASSVAKQSSVQQELGTGWGEIKRSEVVKVGFERKETPEAVLEIMYNTREQLEELGIDFNSRVVYVAPQAFPNDYCEPPVK